MAEMLNGKIPTVRELLLLETESCPKLSGVRSREAVEVLGKNLAKTRRADVPVGAGKAVAIEHVKHLEV